MRRIILDTNVYIAFMNDGLHEGIVLGPGSLRYMSSVVWMELEAGATTKRAQLAVARLARTFAATNRLIAPSPAVWASAGPLLRRLRSAGRWRSARRTLRWRGSIAESLQGEGRSREPRGARCR